MADNMHFFTSVSNNYLPKARILAKSLKKHRPDARFSLVLSDILPAEVNTAEEPFDDIYTIEELGVPVENLQLWIFEHRVVEICTAVKGQALVKFLEEGSEKVVYLDPDIAVFDDLTELETIMDQRAVVLTPHQSVPEDTIMDIRNNEMASLKHGIYNFGFFAVRNAAEGMRFARWWRDRLLDFCFDDIPNGIFTDQRWGDFVPAFFPDHYILRGENYNVSTWNLTHRKVTMDDEGNYFVNGKPLQFYHFSGFDSGAQETMLKFYGTGNPALWSLREWYLQRMDEEGQEEYGKMPSVYAFYSNGEKISDEQRKLVRCRSDVKEWLGDANPHDVDAEKSYYSWYLHGGDHVMPDGAVLVDANKLIEAQKKCAELEVMVHAMQTSSSWRWTAWLRKLKGGA